MTQPSPDNLLSCKASCDLPSPTRVRRRLDELRGRQRELQKRKMRISGELREVSEFLSVSGDVTRSLEALSDDLFRRELQVMQQTITRALQDVLEQPLEFVAAADFKRDMAAVEFSVRRDGQEEDILRGQGGSVTNVVSVGLRMFALVSLDERRHRRFLVLDEQDCWLRPDRVPRLVRIVQESGRALGFQVLMISHHEVHLFERYADRVYRLEPDRGDGVRLTAWQPDHAAEQSTELNGGPHSPA